MSALCSALQVTDGGHFWASEPPVLTQRLLVPHSVEQACLGRLSRQGDVGPPCALQPGVWSLMLLGAS